MSWYYASGNDKLGPFDESVMTTLVKAGKVSRTTMVWRDGMETWKQAGSTELAVQFSSSVTQNVAPPPMMNPALVYPKTPPTSPHIAWLNFLPGLAQIIMGQAGKGVVIMCVSILSIPISPAFPILPCCIPIWLIAIPISIIDAYFVGNTLKAGQPVRKWAFFPSSKSTPTT